MALGKKNSNIQELMTDSINCPFSYLLSIVIPVYNGSRTIGRVVDCLSEIDFGGLIEVILVDDGSIDESAEICKRLAEETDEVSVSFIKLGRNFGEHNAVMAGLNIAQGSYVITMDDDLQNPPAEVLRLYQYACQSQKHVIYTYYGEKKHHWFRNLGSQFANWTATVVLDKPKDLYLSSFRCMSAQTVKEIIKYKGPFPYIDGLIIQVTNAIGSLRVEHLERAEGRSNYTIKRLLRLWTSIALNFSTVPLRIISILGLLANCVSVVLFVNILWEYFYSGITVPGWFSLMSVILFFSGSQMIMLGLAGEYIGRIFQTINHKPQFVIDGVFHKKNHDE